MKIDLGCGPFKKEGYTGIDVYPFDGVDIVYDGKTLPVESDSVDEVYSMHCFEHLDDVFGIMKELFRVCKDGATLNIISPHFSSCRNCYDLEHRRQFGWRTFEHIWGVNPVETLSPHAVDGFFLDRGVKFEWWEHRTLIKKQWPLRIPLSAINATLNAVANRYPFFCDRVWCRLTGGFDNIHYKLEVKKCTPK